MAGAGVTMSVSLSITTAKEKYLKILILPILDSSQDDMKKLPHKYTIPVHYSLKEHNYKVQGRRASVHEEFNSLV